MYLYKYFLAERIMLCYQLEFHEANWIVSRLQKAKGITLIATSFLYNTTDTSHDLQSLFLMVSQLSKREA
jgi:hypothetical protein